MDCTPDTKPSVAQLTLTEEIRNLKAQIERLDARIDVLVKALYGDTK